MNICRHQSTRSLQWVMSMASLCLTALRPLKRTSQYKRFLGRGPLDFRAKSVGGRPLFSRVILVKFGYWGATEQKCGAPHFVPNPEYNKIWSRVSRTRSGRGFDESLIQIITTCGGCRPLELSLRF